MVLLAAAICTKQGKALLSRQFVEMSRARIEGLLSTFPKLMGTGKQHTFVETESVRYVYQPLEKLYMLLITTKTSNMLEDQETLRLFSRVIPEYCSALNEQDILDNAFDLIFAFDEIIALGYRENVNLAQIRTFTEMDSHEEKVYEAMRKSQEKEARDEMKRKAKELQLAKREARKEGRSHYSGGFGGGGGGYGSHDGGRGGMGMGPTVESLPPAEPRPSSYNAAASRSTRPSGTAMKLGKKGKDVESFVDKLVAEGERVASAAAARESAVSSKAATTTQTVAHESVHLRVVEKLDVVVGRDGGVQNMELHGIISLRIADPEYGRVRVALANKEKRSIQFQTHPKVDKGLFNQRGVIAMKQEGASFPISQDVGVLKWRFQTTDESFLPLSINCWPSENNGKCDVNIEYELVQDYLELSDLKISIPIPSGVGSPVIGEVDGEYDYDSKKHLLNWRLPLVDSSNKEGSMEFSVAGIPSDFFPINVSFISNKSYCNVEVLSVNSSDTDEPVKFSSEFLLNAEKFEIV